MLFRTNRSPRPALSIFAASVALAVAATGCQQLGTIDPSQAEVVQFQSCSGVEGFVKLEAVEKLDQIVAADTRGEAYSPYGYTNYAQVGLDASATNNQEAGVDEADLLQVDETHAFALHGQRMIIVEAFGGNSGGQLQIEGAQIVADLPLPGEPLEMFLSGDTAVVMVATDQSKIGVLYESISSKPQRALGERLVEAHVFDVRDRSNPILTRRVAVEGEYIAARRIDNQVYLVSRANLGVTGPQLLVPTDGMDNASWRTAQHEAIMQADLDSWLPYAYSTSFTGGATGQSEASVERAGCGSVYTARTASGDDALGIYSFDISDPSSNVDVTTFIGDGTLVYASLDGLLVAHTNYATARSGGDTEEVEATTIHRFAFDEQGDTEYWATGIVHGWLLNQFGLSEHDGYIRAATQSGRFTTGFKPINLYTMPIARVAVQEDPALQTEENPDGTLSPRKFMRPTGRIEDIAHGEDLFAVRFMGDKAFLITWEEVKGDPLFTVDLRNQDNPEIRGELDIPGFSTYLHPILEGNKLIGIGQNTDDNSVKLSLFDVTRLSNPTAVEEIRVGGSGASSEAETEHRAFRWLPDRNVLAIPVSGSRNTLELFKVEDRGFSNVASIDAGSAEMRRSYRIGDYLYALSEGGLSIVSLNDFGTKANVVFD